jgi:hypothetical protein
MRLAANGPKPVVIDEFPFLAKATPALPSLIQRALEPAAQRRNTPVRLLLCGSALSFMEKLLAGSAPLRGRAGLELLVPTLDYRLAREFWGIGDLRTAVLTNAIVGGTPAYRREFAQDDVPAGPDDFDPWVCRTVLNPGRPLFREARYILAEEPDIHDTALYHAVLAAIAEGNTTRGGIANYLERKSTDLAHPLGVLHDAGLITHETEAFKKNRSAYRIAEPLLTFYHAIMRPAWGDLERPGRAPQVWRRSQHAFHSNVVGPHFEEICRQWTRWHAGPQTYGGAYPARVASGTVSDPEARKTTATGTRNCSGGRGRAYHDEDMGQEMPSPPFPDPGSPVLQLIVTRAIKAMTTGEATAQEAILHAAAHGWYEATSRARMPAPAATSAAACASRPAGDGQTRQQLASPPASADTPLGSCPHGGRGATPRVSPSGIRHSRRPAAAMSSGRARRQISSAASNSRLTGSVTSGGSGLPGQVCPPPYTVHAITRVPPAPAGDVCRLDSSVACVSPGPGGHRSIARHRAALSSRDSARPRSSPFGPRCRE